MGLLAEWCIVPLFSLLGFMLMLFPSGTLPSPRWRPFASLGLLATALAMVGFVVHPRLMTLPAPRATVALSCRDGHLEFSVTDDGTGFDTAHTRHGSGLQGMTDRMSAVGGNIHVHSTPGHGTTVSGDMTVSE